jgi:diguanylate cyclase (GGDEF)-like protein
LPAVTVSLGIAQMQPGQTLDSLISAADSALYRAKAQGRNCISE